MTRKLPAVGLVIALPDELRPIAARLKLRRDGELRSGVVGGHRVLALLGGLGLASAGAAATRLLDQDHCVGLLTVGFGGGLHPELQVADVVAVGTAVYQDGRELPADPHWLSAARPGSSRVGSCLSMLAPVRTPDEKSVLHEVTEADVVDMETWAVAELATRRGVPWVGLRGVSDSAEDAIPRVVHDRIQPERGRFDTPGMVLHVLPRPGHWPDLLALAKRSRQAAAALADATAACLEGLP